MADDETPRSGEEPGGLLRDLAALRRRARADRHAYWFPLLLFGLLIIGAAVLAVVTRPPLPAVAYFIRAEPLPLNGPFLLAGVPGVLRTPQLGWYWLIALIGGIALTAVWYRWHSRRRGVQTRALWFVVTGVALTALVLGLSLLTARLRLPLVVPAQLWARGGLVLFIIAAGLWVLAWAERSPALAAITAAYTGVAFLVTLYNVENLLYYLGAGPVGGVPQLPDLLLPAIVLLAGGLGAAVATRRRARRA